jgi:hypothetical protein
MKGTRMPRSKAKTASYIGPACLDLRNQALEANLPLLAHLLEMATLEALRVEVEHTNADQLSDEP